MRDAFDDGYGARIMRLVALLSHASLILMLCQAVDLFDIDEIPGMWEIPWTMQGLSDIASMEALQVGARPYAFLAGFNVASYVLYLSYRSLFVFHDKKSYLYLAFIAVVLSTAKMLLLFFVVFEIIIPMMTGRQKASFFIAGITVSAGVVAAAQIFPEYALFQIVREFNDAGADGIYSLTNRLASYQWLLDNLDQAMAFGGPVSRDFLQLRPVDSELVLRSMQFGLIGFALINALVYYYFARYRGRNARFLLWSMLWTSLTFTAASNFVFLPFLLLYGLVCRQTFTQTERRAQASPITSHFIAEA
jgi:hypothetical protein